MNSKYIRSFVNSDMSILQVGCHNGIVKFDMGCKVTYLMTDDEFDLIGGDLGDREAFVGELEEQVNALVAAQRRFDFIILDDVISGVPDIEEFLVSLQGLCFRNSLIVLSHYSMLWRPVLALAASLGLKRSDIGRNWLSKSALLNLVNLSNFELVVSKSQVLIPFGPRIIFNFANNVLSQLPILNWFCLRSYLLIKMSSASANMKLTSSIIIPCRNEFGNIEDAVARLPRFSHFQEIIFVEGGSSDQTYEECLRVKQLYPDRNISVLKQNGEGKWGAVQTGFEKAVGDVLMILDADLTVPPESLPKFYQRIARQNAGFVNGTRLIYPIEKGAMQTLNFFANHVFAFIFSYIIRQPISDSLCGTKVLLRSDYQKAMKAVSALRLDDPFGDFSLLYGASLLNLKIVEIPVRYKSRGYGETQISRFVHGVYLLKMALQGLVKLRFR